MIVALQVLFAGIACFGLWWLWRAFVSSVHGDRAFLWIVVAGFLARALGSQALFWVSYFRLPLLRSLQLGDGFWFFAIDGPIYLERANKMVREGLLSPFSLQNKDSSRAFVELVALLVSAFGSVASVAILLNCAAYLATCVLLLRIGRPARLPRLVALIAISFGPATILWSLQLLKDTLFLLLVVALAAALWAWQETVADKRPRVSGRSRVIALAVAILFLIYALAGLRWYFAVIICAVSALFLFLTALSSPRRMRAMLYGVTLFALLAASVRIGAGGDMVPFINFAMKKIGRDASVAAPVAVALNYVGEVRRGFDTTTGATTIAAPSPVRAPTDSGPASADARTATRRFALRQTTRERFVTGSAATFLPRAIGQWLGLIEIRGGRGFWVFVDLDTLTFDAVLLFTPIYCTVALRRRQARVTPLFVLVLLVFIVTTIPMVYSVSNFGTMFRLRQMLYVLVVILPLTLRPEQSAREQLISAG